MRGTMLRRAFRPHRASCSSRLQTWLLAAFAALAFGAASTAGAQSTYTAMTGSYVGDGVAGRSIAGLGFRPDFVVIKADMNENAVVRSSTMVGDATKPLGSATPIQSDRIVSLDINGFTVGGDNDVNKVATTYYWVAFRGAPGEMVTGSYTGNGASGRTISGLGLQPAFVIILPEHNQHAGQRFNYQSSDRSFRFDNSAEGSNRIQSFVADGFTVGSDNSVNQSDRVFHYVAWKEVAAAAHSGYYQGNGSDNRNLTMVGFQPGFMLTKGSWSTAPPVLRSDAMPNDYSFYADRGVGFSNAIQRFLVDGFQLGSHSSVNNSFEQYYYIAFLRVAPPGADLAVGKTVDKPNPAVGETIGFTVTLTNQGPAQATGVVLTDILPGGVTYESSAPSQGAYSTMTGIWSVGTLAAGATAGLVLRAMVDAGTGGRTITNVATVTASNQSDGDPSNNSASASIVVQSADLAVSKSVDRDDPNVMETIRYAVTITNNGPNHATSVSAIDQLPSGLTLLAAAPSQGSYTGSTGLWSVGDIAAGEAATLTLDAAVNTGTGGEVIENIAAATHVVPEDPVSENDEASVSIRVQGVDLSLQKSVDRATPRVGETIRYTIAMTNDGPDRATGIAVTDLIPSGLSFVSSNPSQGSYAHSTGIWSAGALEPETAAVLTIDAIVAAGTGGSTITNTAAVTSIDQEDAASDNDAASVSLTVQSADLAVTKTVDRSSPNEGDTVQYTVNLANGGPSAASSIALFDLLPAGLTYLSSAPSQGSYSSVTGIWTVGNVASGGGASLPITARVNAGTSGQRVTNTASLSSSSQEDPFAGNNTASVAIDVTGADLSVTKEVDRTAPNEGDPVTFTITLSNNGPSDATGIAATDILPTGLSYVSSNPSKGSYDPSTGLWDVGALSNGTSATLALVASVNSGTEGLAIINQVRVTAADQGDPVPANDLATATITVQGTDLGIDLSVDRPFPTVGDAIRYTVALTNHGPGRATDVSVLNALPSQVTYVSCEPGQGSFSPSAGRWSVGDLDDGAAVNLVITATVNAGTTGATVTDTAAIEHADQADPNPANNSDAVSFTVAGADLSLSMSVDNSTPSVGDPVLYTLTVTNLGPDAASGVVVSDILPEGLSYEGASANRGTYAPASGAWSVGPLSDGESAVLLLTVRVEAEAAGETITNIASIASAAPADPDSDNNLVSVPVQVQEAMAGILITPQPQEGQVLLPGAAPVSILQIVMENTSDLPASLSAITVSNKTAGPGSPQQLDADWSTLSLSVGEVGGNEGEVIVGRATLRSGVVTFSQLPVAINPGQALRLTVLGGASINARSGDLLDLVIPGPEAFGFATQVNVQGSWPVDPLGDYLVQGIAAAQIGLTPVQSGIVYTGERDRLALSFLAPSNGYEPDLLRGVRIENLGDARAQEDIAGLSVWADGGNGTFDEGGGDDILQGIAVSDGVRWNASGLSIEVPVGGRLIFASVTIDPEAEEDRTIRLSLPVLPNEGLTMASGCIGPRDRAVGNPELLTIREGEVGVVAFTADQPSVRTLLPGAAPQEIFYLRGTNLTDEPVTMTSVTFENTTIGKGTTFQIDQSWQPLNLTIIGTGKSGEDSLYASPAEAAFSAGRITFHDLSTVLLPRQSITIAVTGGASLGASDGDEFDLRLARQEDLAFDHAIPVQAEFPLDPAGSFVVNGMVAGQITLRPVPQENLAAGSIRNLALDVIIPPNGYEEDRLVRIDVVNNGTAVADLDISRVELWADEGDGGFSADHDRRIGGMVYTGERWEITGLSEPVHLAGLRLFVAVDISDIAAEGRTVRLGLPAGADPAIGMASGNDGPIDRPVENATSRLISGSDRLTIAAEELPGGVVRPGTRDLVLLHFVVTNTYSSPHTVSGLTITSTAAGSGDQGELDSTCDLIGLYDDSNGDGVLTAGEDGPLLASGSFSNGSVVFRGLQVTVSPNESRHLFVTANVSTRNAVDGVTIGAMLAEAFDIEFVEPVAAVAQWPVRSAAHWTLDGMVAAQIVNYGSGVATLGQGQGPAVAMDFTIPSNGYLNDTLRRVRLTNAGSAGPAHVHEVTLWRDDGDGAFSPTGGSDRNLGAMTWTGTEWMSELLSESLDLNGVRCFATVKAASVLVQAATVQLRIPQNGIEVDSANDGPIDQPVQNPDAILISPAPLLTTIETHPSASTLAALFSVRMRIENASDEAINSITPSPLGWVGSSTVTVVDGPSPPMLDLNPGESGEIVWTCTSSVTGEVRLTGYAEGTGAFSGTPWRSLDSYSGTHFIYSQANVLEFFAVSTPPFSVSRGQTGVVPITLTYRNPGGERGSNVELTALKIRLEDESGRGLVPSEVLERVVVREGNRIYLVKARTALESAGSEMDLSLSTPVIVTTAEPATLNLQFDVAVDAVTPTFRAVIMDDSWLQAEDVTSRTPVAFDLLESTYPIRSGLARIVAEATSVEISAPEADTLRVGPGQHAVQLVEITLTNVGISGISSDVRVGGFVIDLVSAEGAPILDPHTCIQTIRVSTPYQTLLDRPVVSTAADSLILQLASPLMLSVNNPVVMTISGDLAGELEHPILRARLRGSTSFDIRDVNTRNQVPANYMSPVLEGPPILIESPATSVMIKGAPAMPSFVTVGERHVPAITGEMRHPGGMGTARISPQAIVVECRDAERSFLAPARVLSSLELLSGDRAIATITDLSGSSGSVEIPIDGISLDPGDRWPFQIRVSINPSAPALLMELLITGSNIRVVDANSGSILETLPDEGADLPLFSGLTRLTPPARELLVGMNSLMPAALAADGRDCPVAALTLANPAAEGLGAISIGHLRIRAADTSGAPVHAGAAITHFFAFRDESPITQSAMLTPDSTTCDLVFAPPLKLEPGEGAAIEIRMRTRAGGTASRIRLGFEKGDIGIMQPEEALLAVEARPVADLTFPMWTEEGSFTGESMEESYRTFPNPFAAGREETTIVYYLASDSEVSLRIRTLRGESVIVLLEGESQPAGLHQESKWDGKNARGSVVTNGVYIAELTVKGTDGRQRRFFHKVAVVR